MRPFQPIFEGSQGWRLKQKPPEGCSLAHSRLTPNSLLVRPRPACVGVAPPTVSWTPLHQSVSHKCPQKQPQANLMAAVLQFIPLCLSSSQRELTMTAFVKSLLKEKEREKNKDERRDEKGRQEVSGSAVEAGRPWMGLPW